MNEREIFLEELATQGYSIRDAKLSEIMLKQMREQVLIAVDKEAEIVGTKDYQDYGILLCTPYHHRVFIDLMDHDPFFEPIEWALGPGFITYLYSSINLPPSGGKPYTSHPHVDFPRIVSDFMIGLGAMICLDDYTLENGATWVLPASQNMPDKPDNTYFYENAKRLTLKKGSALFFNPRLWHASGENKTADWRCALNFGMSRPWVKQRVDIPRFLDKVLPRESISEKVQQRLGYHAQAPASFEDYYAPREKRSFKQAYF